MRDIKFQRGLVADMPDINRLVEAVFSGEQGIPKEMIPIPDEQAPMWWCAKAGGKIIGTTAVFCEEGSWHMGRITIDRELRGQGLGKSMLRFVLAEAFAEGIDEVYLEARDATVHILRQLGGEVVGEPFEFYGGNVTPVVVRKTDMERNEKMMEVGKMLYLTKPINMRYTYCNRNFAPAGSDLPWKYILVEDRFTTGHDDSAGFVEIINTAEEIVKSWKFETVDKILENPNVYEDECLVFYLKEKFGLPVVNGGWGR